MTSSTISFCCFLLPLLLLSHHRVNGFASSIKKSSSHVHRHQWKNSITVRRSSNDDVTEEGRHHILSSRRNAILTGATTVISAATTTTAFMTTTTKRSWAIIDESDSSLTTGSSSSSPERMELLSKISTRAPDQEVAVAISRLEPLDPSKGKAAIDSHLSGTWELIYSVNAEAFSPLLNLPKIVRPTSYQLVGDDAAAVVGEGRIAQLLNFPILPLRIILSSGTLPVSSDLSTLEIFPPFRLEVALAGTRIKIVESGSDADFRALNARSDEAQAAGRNMYKQRYLETSGGKGDLRISEVVAGDPVLVGQVFVHRRT